MGGVGLKTEMKIIKHYLLSFIKKNDVFVDDGNAKDSVTDLCHGWGIRIVVSTDKSKGVLL